MAIRIQLRRDTEANWASENPVLRAGEIGIETDTLKFKIGNGSTAWNSITTYANVVPGDLNTTLSDYVLVTDIGDTVAGLDGNQNLLIPNDSVIFEGATPDSYELTLVATDPTADRTITLPDATGTVALTTDIPSTTDTLTEGTTNLYFTDERAVDSTAAALAAGTHTNITVTYDDNAGSISLTGAQTYSDENAQDAVGNAVDSTLSYNDTTGAIRVATENIAISSFSKATSDINLNNNKIINLATPINGTDAATKEYVDSSAEGLLTKPAVDVATTANVTATYSNGTSGVGATLTIGFSGELNIDGKTSWAQYDSVLFKDQTDPAENGRYVLTTVGQLGVDWVFTRCGLCDEADEIPGAYMFVLDGTVNAQTGWVLHVDDPTTFTVGTDDIDVYQFSGAGTYSAGTGLTLTGTVFSINTGTTADLSTAQTLTNKTIDAASNTITGVINNTLTTTTGDVIYASSANTPARLGIGSTGQLLTVVGGIPAWANAPISLPTQTGNSGKYLTTDGTDASWQTVSSTIGSTVVAAGATVTKIDGLTLGSTSSTTVNTNSATTVDTIALNAFTTAKYVVSIKQGSKIRSSEIIAQTDGTSVDYSEFGVVETGGPMNGILVAASVSSTNCVLQVTITDAVITNATVKIQKVLI